MNSQYYSISETMAVNVVAVFKNYQYYEVINLHSKSAKKIVAPYV